WAFDEFGRVVQSSDSRGQTLTSWDALNRKISEGAPGQKGLSYSYVPDTTLQRWTTVVTLAGQGNYEYRGDSKGRTADLLNPNGQLAHFEYGLNGETVLKRLPNGTEEDYGYTDRGWLAWIEYWQQDGN